MDGDAFAYDGESGQWSYWIYQVQVDGDAFSAAAEIYLCGKHRCKLVLSMPVTEREAGVELLKRRCLAWIAGADESVTPTANRIGNRAKATAI